MLTMRYRILDTPENYRAAREDIDLVLLLMNARFTWTRGPLSLTPCATPTRDPATGASVAARGKVVVAEDRWSALLVVCFLRWVSERLPQSFVELDDESGLCHLGRVTFKTGRFGIPVPRDARARRRLVARLGGTDALKRAIWRAADGDFLLEVHAWPYAARREVQRLGLRERSLRRISLQQLAARMPFPWKTECLGAT